MVNLSIGEKDSQFDLGIFFQYLGSEVYAHVLLKILDSLIPQKWPLLKWNDQTTATKISMITIQLSIFFHEEDALKPDPAYARKCYQRFFHLTLPHRTAAFVRNLVASNLKRSRERRVCCDAHVYQNASYGNLQL